MRESLMGERDSKQHLESTGRETLLLMGATQLGLDASTRALGQTRDPSGLILALRVTKWCINRTIMQWCSSSRIISTPSTCERLFKVEVVFLCLSPWAFSASTLCDCFWTKKMSASATSCGEEFHRINTSRTRNSLLLFVWTYSLYWEWALNNSPLFCFPHALSPAPAPFQCTLCMAMPKKRVTKSCANTPFSEWNPIQDNALLIRKEERRWYSNRTALQRLQNHPQLPRFPFTLKYPLYLWPVASPAAHTAVEAAGRKSSKRASAGLCRTSPAGSAHPQLQGCSLELQVVQSASQKVIKASARHRN